MKILHVIGSMNPASGGPCQGIRNSIQVLEKLGVYREVVSVDDPQSFFLVNDTLPIHALGPSKTAWCYSKSFLPWLIENIRRFDIVIINGLWLYPGYAIRKAIKLLKKNPSLNNHNRKIPKVFVMPHGMLDPYFQRASHRKLKAIRNWIYWKLIEQKVVNEAEGLLFTCETELLLARQTFRPYHPKKELNVGYGVVHPPPYCSDMQKAFIAKCPQVQSRPYLLFLSRIDVKKGVDLLIKAYIEITEKKDTYTNVLPSLVFAGPGLDTQFGREMQKLALKTDASIIFPGMLSGDAKWGAFYGCGAFLLPSHQENFGIAVAEALACSKPVLISNQVNIWSEIAGAGGGIVADDTLEGTKELLRQWLTLTEGEKQIMGQNALKAYEAHFSIEPAAQKFLNAITS